MVSCCTLPRYHSYHHLLLLSTSMARFRGPRLFQFHGMWIEHPGFMDLVCTTWLIPVTPMRVVIGKLKALKSTLKVWNRELFDNLDHNIDRATLIELQNRYDDDSFSEELLNMESDVHVDLDILLY